MARLPWLSDVTPIDPQDAPFVSIIFAARDEAEKLPAAIATMLAQDYPRFEVVAVNDRSATSDRRQHRYAAAGMAGKTTCARGWF
jgi:cellulose synthase/poly-beta-1,6-N-acetylglucosamine synthase-like glycosyltransferase